MAGTARRLYDKRSTGTREEWLTSNNVSQLFNLMNEALGRISNLESSVSSITSAGYVGGAGVTNYHAVWSSVDTLRASAHVFDDNVNQMTGFGTVIPLRRVGIFDSAEPQLRLTQADGTVYTDFQTDPSGNLYIEPTGKAVGVNMGADLIPAWDLNGVLHIGNDQIALYGQTGGVSGGLACNMYCDGAGAWRCTAGSSHATRIDITTTAMYLQIFDEVATGAVLPNKYTITFNSSGVLELLNELKGAATGAHDFDLKMRAYFDAGEHYMVLRFLTESATTYKMQLLNESDAEMAYIDEAGHAAILNQTIIGSVTVAQIGELDVYQTGCPVNPYFNLRHGDVSHGMTNYLSADAFFLADIRDETYGGVNLIGASETTAQTPMSIYGIAGSYCGSQPYMKFIVGKDDGASGITNIGDTEIGFDFKDYTQSLVKIYGDGDVWILGNLTINDIPALGSAATVILTHTAGLVQSRTAAQALSDIGAASAASISGTENYLAKFGAGGNNVGNSIVQQNTQAIGINMGAVALPAWAAPALNIGGAFVAIGTNSINHFVLGYNCYDDGAIKAATNSTYAWRTIYTGDYSTPDRWETKYYTPSAAGEALGSANLKATHAFMMNTTPYLLLSNDINGAATGPHGMYLKMQAYHDATALSMSWKMLTESTTTYKMQLLNNSSAEVGYIDEAGNTYLKGMVGIGAEPATNQLTIYQADCPSVPYIECQNGAITNPFTDYMGANSIFHVDLQSETYGGAVLRGFIETLAQSPAMQIDGFATSPCAGNAYMEFRVGADSGTGATNIGDTEVAFEWKDYNQSLAKIYGNGNMSVLGSLTATALIHEQAIATNLTVAAGNTMITGDIIIALGIDLTIELGAQLICL